MKVTINEEVQDVQHFSNSMGNATYLGGKQVSLISSDGLRTMEAGRIHLNQVDLNMIKSSFEKDSSARVASVGDQGIGREKLHTQ